MTRYPTLTAATHLGEKRIAAFCAKMGYGTWPTCDPSAEDPSPRE